jgi:hypothetical protein
MIVPQVACQDSIRAGPSHDLLASRAGVPYNDMHGSTPSTSAALGMPEMTQAIIERLG